MANFQRLIFLALVALSSWLPASSYALISYTATESYSLSLNGAVCGGSYSGTGTLAELSQGLADVANANCSGGGWVSNAGTPWNGGSAIVWIHNSNTGADANAIIYSAPTVGHQCSSGNATYPGSGSTCNCVTGYGDVAGVCVAGAKNAVLGKAVADGLNLTGIPVIGSGGGLSACYGGVVVTGSGSASGGGKTEYYGPFTSDGTACDSSTAGTAAPADPVACASSGGAWGSVNGKSVCVDQAVKSSTGTAAAGTSTTTNSDGSSTSTAKNTVCDGVNCVTTTTTTTTSSSGVASAPAVTTKTDPQPSFCSDNPNSPVCKSSSYSAGQCGSPPACDGDAIQCGIALSQFQTACALSPTPGDESALYDSSKTKTGSQVVPGDTVNISSASFSTTNLLAGSVQGLSDLSVTVWGKPINLPLSNLNQYLAAAGNALLAVAFILSISIIRGK